RSRSLEDVLEQHLEPLGVPCSTSCLSVTASIWPHFRSAFVVRSTATGVRSRSTIPCSDRELQEEAGMNKRWLAALILGVAVLGVVAFASTAGGSSSKSGGTFRVGSSSGIDSLNPYVAFNQDAYATFQYIYPILVQYDKTNLRFAPFFAIFLQ